ncbi:MAG: ATP-binding cassette domain-containing protein [Acidimicrobiia bacterium]
MFRHGHSRENRWTADESADDHPSVIDEESLPCGQDLAAFLVRIPPCRRTPLRAPLRANPRSGPPGCAAPSAIWPRSTVSISEIGRGEIYGLLGPSGAGKSTTLKMLCTLLAPTGGQATVAGFDIATQAQQVRLHIGVALQDVALDPKQTGLELLRLQGRLYGLTGTEVDLRLAELRSLVDLGDALERRIGTYSGGMQRRLDLAAALVHNPDVLFLDEPTTGLDPISRARVWDEVRRLNEELGMTILLTTQYLEEADELADRVGIVDRGILVAQGTPTELKRRVGTDLVIVRIDGDTTVARQAIDGAYGVNSIEGHGHELTVSVEEGSASVGPIAIALHDAGVRVLDLTLRTPTLDDVFLELTGGHLADQDIALEEEYA